jgi:hypothetical protein
MGTTCPLPNRHTPVITSHSFSVMNTAFCSALGTAITAKEPEGAQAGFLDNVFGVVIVAHQPARQIVCGVEMRQRNLFKADRLALFRQKCTSLMLRPSN